MATHTSEQLRLLSLSTFVCSVIGAIGALSILILFPLSKVFRASVIARICFAISLADLISTGAQLVGQLGPNAGDLSLLCQIQAALQHFGEVASVLLVGCIIINLLFVVWYYSSYKDIKRFDLFSIPLVYAFAAIVAGVPMFIQDRQGVFAYGSVRSWCYIVPQHRYLMFTLYGPLIFVLGLALVAFIIIKMVEHQQLKETAHFKGRVHDPCAVILPGVLLVYVVASLITWMPVLAVFVLKSFYPKDSIFALSLVNAALLPLRGFTDALAAVYQAWRSRESSLAQQAKEKLSSIME